MNLEIGTPNSEWVCRWCGRTFKNKRTLDSHSRTHLGATPFKCEVCIYSTSRAERLDSHVRRKHEKSCYKYRCKVCGRTFDQKRHLDIHSLVHFEERLFKCDLCKYSTSRKVYLDTHIRLRHTCSYTCKVCGCTFKNKSDLCRHRRVHSLPSKGHVCNLCGGTFKQKNYLAVHMRIHSGERPYQCKFCNYRASQKSCLNAHMRAIHLKNQTTSPPKRGPSIRTGTKARENTTSHSTL